MARHSSTAISMRAMRTVRRAGLVALVGVASACSSGGAETSPTSGAESLPPAADEPADGSGDDLFVEAETEAPVVVSFDPVVETGVPGIDSDDAFCRSWSEFAGSIQAISLAWFVQQPADAAVLEVAAAHAVVDAAAGLAEHLPAELEANRQAFTIDVPTPTLRRAEAALAALADAGVGAEAIELLGDAWIAAITDAGVDAEDVEIEVPEGAEGLGDAAAAFAIALPPFIEDPTLNTTAFDIGPSLAYISDNCPDQATLAGNDNID